MLEVPDSVASRSLLSISASLLPHLSLSRIQSFPRFLSISRLTRHGAAFSNFPAVPDNRRS